MASSTKPKREEKEKTEKYKKKESEKSRKEEEKREKMESFENKTFRGQSVLQKHSPLRIKKLLKMIIQKPSRSLSLLSKPLVRFLKEAEKTSSNGELTFSSTDQLSSPFELQSLKTL